MARKHRTLSQRDLKKLDAALGEVDRLTAGMRSMIGKSLAAPGGRGGGTPCGVDYALKIAGAPCGREYALKVGGTPCVKNAEAQIETVAKRS